MYKSARCDFVMYDINRYTLHAHIKVYYTHK